MEYELYLNKDFIKDGEGKEEGGTQKERDRWEWEEEEGKEKEK